MRTNDWQKRNLELFSHHNHKFLSPPRMPEQPTFQAFPSRADEETQTFVDLIIVLIAASVLLGVGFAAFTGALA
jgi:hypothetical protein